MKRECGRGYGSPCEKCHCYFLREAAKCRPDYYERDESMKGKGLKEIALAVLLAMITIFVVACNDYGADEQDLDSQNVENQNLESHNLENQNEESLTDESEEDVGQLLLAQNSGTYLLPPPVLESNVSIEETLANRRSHRNFEDRALSVEQLSQILWAAYGVTDPRGFRTAPSAGALFPLEIFVLVGNVEGMEAGVYPYVAREHKLIQILDRDIREELSEAAWGQTMVKEAPVVVVYTAVFSRTTGRYGERGRRYVYMEVGHSAQNVYLQVEALGLGTCAVGAFADDTCGTLIGLAVDAEEEILYLMPVGYVVSR